MKARLITVSATLAIVVAAVAPAAHAGAIGRI
jgi:hypothetical protein